MNKFSVMIASGLVMGIGMVSTSAIAFPGTKIKPTAAILQQELASKVSVGQSKNKSGASAKRMAERAPMSMRLGARSHLFDGYFLCDMPERPSVLAGFRAD